MNESDWKCAGCGKPSPHRVRACDCPTNCVVQGSSSAWKREAGTQEASDRCHKLLARFYEMPVTKMDGGLTIVSTPHWLDAKDVDLIKAALKHYADVQLA